MNDSNLRWLALHTEMKTGSKITYINYSNSATCTRMGRITKYKAQTHTSNLEFKDSSSANGYKLLRAE